MPFPQLYQSEKRLVAFPGWSEPEQETDYVWFHSPIEVGGVVEADFILSGGAYKYHPDKHISFELRVGIPGRRRKVPLARIDWRALSGGHSNRRGPDLPWAGRRVGDSHVHGFEINWLENEGRMRTDLSQAEPLPEQIQSFESLLDYTGKLFRISNIDIVSRPDWEYRLFHDG